MADLLTTAQAATLLGKHHSTIRYWVATGQLKPTHKNPGRSGAYLFDRKVIETLVKTGLPERIPA